MKFLDQAPDLFFYEDADRNLASMLPGIRFLSENVMDVDPGCVTAQSLLVPDETFAFLHEAAVITHKGILYTSWYNCPQKELMGYTPICGKRSADGGKTWSDLEILDHDPSGKILFCPPIYGIENDRLYMFMNEMVAPDHIHALNLYILDEETGKFCKLWSRPIPFKLNTNVIPLPNGKLLLPGRVGLLDQFPNTPAVMISDSGKMDGPWRIVKATENGDLPDGKVLVHPETTVMIEGNTLYMFDRNDQRRVPLVHLSNDWGESWLPTYGHDIPYISSKIYAGDLSDGRHYLACNIDNFDRSRLAVYFTEARSDVFSKCLIIFDNARAELPGVHKSHYPCLWESDGVLYAIATAEYPGNIRGAALYTIDLKKV